MNLKLTSILITSFIAFIITGIPTVLENLFLQAEEAEQIQDQSPPTLDENNNGIISEEICPPYCNSPPPIQELPQKQPP